MTYENHCTLPEELLEQIAIQGKDYIPDLIRIMVNEAMKAERSQYLGAAPCEQSRAIAGAARVCQRVQAQDAQDTPGRNHL